MQKVIDELFALHFGFKTKSTFALDSAFEILKHSNNNTRISDGQKLPNCSFSGRICRGLI